MFGKIAQLLAALVFKIRVVKRIKLPALRGRSRSTATRVVRWKTLRDEPVLSRPLEVRQESILVQEYLIHVKGTEQAYAVIPHIAHS